MAKTYKILVNDGKGTDIKPVSVVQGAGAKGDTVRMEAKRGWRFEVQDDLKGKGLAPDQMRLKRMGKNLAIMFDGSQNADVLIEDFYADNKNDDKDNGMPMLIGQAEDGGLYEYVPQDPAASSMPSQLKDGNTPVIVALGGGPLPSDFVLAGLPLVAAGVGLGGWLAGGAAAAAAAGGGGGGGGGAVAVLPAKATGSLTHDVLNDTGTSQTDSITNKTTPTLTINAEKGATVVVTVNGKEYPATETSTAGVYTATVTDGLKDGKYTPTIKVTNSVGSTTSEGDPFTVDSSASNNQPDNQVDPNKDAVIAVTAVSEDTGGNATDFITTDTTVIASGMVNGFSSTGAAAGERFRVQILGTDGLVKAQEFVTPASDGKWTMTTATSALALGDYTIKAEILDVAGNVVRAGEHALKVVDKSLTAKPDKATVQEDITLTVQGDLIRGASNGDGTDIDTNEGFETLIIDKIKAGNGTFQSVGTEVEINGEYGKLKIGNDGKYTYTLNNNDAKVQALTSGGTPGIDEFTYEVTNASGQRSSTTFKVNVNGLDDAATIVLPLEVPKKFVLPSDGTDNFTRSISVTDKDAAQNGLDVLTAGSEFVGSFSTFKIEPVSAQSYKWTFDKPASITASETINRHDLYTLNSKDGSASLTFDFVVNATGTATTQEFHTSTVQGLKIEAAVSNTTDKVVLHGSQLEFDFAAPAANIKSIEKIDITGTGNNTIKLSLASLTQADTVDHTATGVHKLFIDGNAGDVVNIANANIAADTTTVSGYNRYVFNSTHELLIQQALTTNFVG